jgi:hypothetical protein
MENYTFKVGDRVRHIKLRQAGRVIHITRTEPPGSPGKKKTVYRVQFDNFPDTIEVREGELVPE